MAAQGIFQILLFFGLVLLLVKPLGLYMARVFNGERTFLDRVLGPVERLIYRIGGIDPKQEQHWTTYTVAMLLFSAVGLLLLYDLQRLQHLLPFNPQGLWPGGPRSRVQYGRQLYDQHELAGIWRREHDGLSGADGRADRAELSSRQPTGIAIAIALIRGFARHSMQTHRQLLGRPGPRHAVCPAADLS